MTSNDWPAIRSLWRSAEERPRATRSALRVLRRHFHEEGIVERMAAFEDFIVQSSRSSVGFQWGISDCSLMVADWCMANGHDDPAAALRGTYHDEQQCRSLIDASGDLVDVVSACAASARLKRINEPQFGCVAVVGSACRPDRQWAAIWNGARWAVWTVNGNRSEWQPMMAKALCMWRV